MQDFITTHSKITRERLNELMIDTQTIAQNIGTISSGENAEKEGIIDLLGGLHCAMEKLYELIGKN